MGGRLTALRAGQSRLDGETRLRRLLVAVLLASVVSWLVLGLEGAFVGLVVAVLATVVVTGAILLFGPSGVDRDVPTGNELGGVLAGQRDEIDALREAVQTAETRAALQAELASRQTALLLRQLGRIDELEAKETDPVALGELFGLDHLATRMRRHAEGVLVLSGGQVERVAPAGPVDLSEALRGAVAEVEDFSRVDVSLDRDVPLQGAAVADVVHLLAELVENATLFSSPASRVRVHGRALEAGYEITVGDQGVGIDPGRLGEIAALLGAEHPPLVAGPLGYQVVGRLAARHGIRVLPGPATDGGTRVVVTLPAALVGPLDEPQPSTQLATQLATQPATQPATQLATEPATEPATQPAAQSGEPPRVALAGPVDPGAPPATAWTAPTAPPVAEPVTAWAPPPTPAAPPVSDLATAWTAPPVAEPAWAAPQDHREAAAPAATLEPMAWEAPAEPTWQPPEPVSPPSAELPAEPAAELPAETPADPVAPGSVEPVAPGSDEQAELWSEEQVAPSQDQPLPGMPEPYAGGRPEPVSDYALAWEAAAVAPAAVEPVEPAVRHAAPAPFVPPAVVEPTRQPTAWAETAPVDAYRSDAVAATTPAGLARRVPQANMAPQMPSSDPVAEQAEDLASHGIEQATAEPTRAAAVLSAYRSGTSMARQRGLEQRGPEPAPDPALDPGSDPASSPDPDPSGAA